MKKFREIPWMPTLLKLFLLLSVVFALTGCKISESDLQSTIAVAYDQTSAVNPTATLAPTNTQNSTSTTAPTYTIYPTGTKLPTYTIYPTYTAMPSYTPLATNTNYPTNTPYHTATSRPTYTALPTYTSLPSLTPRGTYTALPTHTALPTLTALPTYTAVVKIVNVTPTTDESILKAPKKDGFYLVGPEIAPGIWRTEEGKARCYWKVTDIKGRILSNFLGAGGGTVALDKEAFQLEIKDCGDIVYLHSID